MLCDESQPRDEKVKYPCIKYMMQFPGFEQETDYVKSYVVPPSIHSIEWLNQVETANPCFLAANDKKIRLFKFNSEVIEEHSDSSEGEFEDEPHSFVQKFAQTNGEIVFPRRIQDLQSDD